MARSKVGTNRIKTDLMALPYAHTFYFELSETDESTVRRFVDACDHYLKDPGQTYFAVGIRDRTEQRGVSATYFEVSVNMVFRDKAAYELYRNDPEHLEFVTEVAGMSQHRQVYDSFLLVEHRKNTRKRNGETK